MVVDSKKEQLEFEDIIKISLAETKSEYSLSVAFVSVIKELTLPGAFSVRMGNTIFIVHPQKGKVGYVFFRALNADTAKNYIEHSKKFTNQMRDKGYNIDEIGGWKKERDTKLSCVVFNTKYHLN